MPAPSPTRAARRAAHASHVGRASAAQRLGQRRRRAVLVREHQPVRRAPLVPGQPELRVQGVDAVLGAGVVGRRAQVGGDGAVGEGEEGVPETLGQVHGLQRSGRRGARRRSARRSAEPTRRSTTTSSSGARGALHVLGLAGRHVGVVDPAQHPPAGYARVGLRHMQPVPDGPGEHLRLEGRGERPARVGEDRRAEQPRTGHRQLPCLHGRRP